MSEVVNIGLDGFAELEDQLAQLDIATQKTVLRKAARESAEPIRAQMVTNYHSQWQNDTGQLQESISTRVSIPKNPGFADVVASVGVFKSRKAQVASGKELDAPVYAWWLEHGTRSHSLSDGASLKRYSTGSRRREAARRNRPGQDSGQQHPGFSAKPFIRPAFDSNMNNALEIQKRTLAEAIDRALRRTR